MTNFINLGTVGKLGYLREGPFNESSNIIIGHKIIGQAGAIE